MWDSFRFIGARLRGGGAAGQAQVLISLQGFATNSHQAQIVGIDQSQTRRWLNLSETAECRLYSTRQTADSGDYWQEANSLSSVHEWASSTALGVKVYIIIMFVVYFKLVTFNK